MYCQDSYGTTPFGLHWRAAAAAWWANVVLTIFTVAISDSKQS